MIYEVNKVQRDLRLVKTVEGALMVQTPSLASIKKRYGEKAVEAYIKLWLIQLNEYLNVKRYLTEIQIDECARLILRNYWGVTIADITIIFRGAKTGAYGELYETLNVSKILSWFKDYYDKRLETAGEMSRQKHQKNTYHGEKLERVRDVDREKYREALKKYTMQQLKIQNKGGKHED